MTNEERRAALEAIIYAADEPATIDQLAVALGEEKLAVRSSLDELVAAYSVDDHGIEIREVAGGFKLYTKPQQHDVVRRFIKNLRPPLRLTMPALETLAVISYKQPVTGPEISEIRGVNTSGVLKTLLDKRLITTAGRKEVIGRPILYRTSKEFLMRFGLSDLQELPSLKEFEALAREALGSDEGVVAAEPDELPTDELDEVLDVPDPAASFSYAHASNQPVSANPLNNDDARGHSPRADFDGEHMPINKNAASGSQNQKQDSAEQLIADEVTATNEGMPAGETDADPKDPKEVQSPEAFDSEKENEARKSATAANSSSADSRSASAGE